MYMNAFMIKLKPLLVGQKFVFSFVSFFVFFFHAACNWSRLSKYAILFCTDRSGIKKRKKEQGGRFGHYFPFSRTFGENQMHLKTQLGSEIKPTQFGRNVLAKTCSCCCCSCCYCCCDCCCLLLNKDRSYDQGDRIFYDIKWSSQHCLTQFIIFASPLTNPSLQRMDIFIFCDKYYSSITSQKMMKPLYFFLSIDKVQSVAKWVKLNTGKLFNRKKQFIFEVSRASLLAIILSLTNDKGTWLEQ